MTGSTDRWITRGNEMYGRIIATKRNQIVLCGRTFYYESSITVQLPISQISSAIQMLNEAEFEVQSVAAPDYEDS